MSKFKVETRTSSPASGLPITEAQFSAGADMVQSQTGGRPLKPIRVNFDMEPEIHRRLKIRAIDKGISVAQLVRQLIDIELQK